jgi:microsomal dipeptidase-like Zn-dependent dipeptidase
VCGTRPADVARAIRHVVDLVGDSHAALGSDWDGARTVGFDAAHLPVLTQALLDAGLGDASIHRVLGENALRVLAATLPER